MAAAAGRGRTQDIVGHTSVLWRGARVGILFLIIYTVVIYETLFTKMYGNREEKMSGKNTKKQCKNRKA